MKIIVAGGSGFIGQSLVEKLLAEHHTVVLLSRNPEKTSYRHPSLILAHWDAKTLGAWAADINGADGIINLAGESIAAKRWTASQKTRLRESRMNATRALIEAIANASKKPLVLVNASAVGYYGDVPDGDVLESTPAGKDFLSGLCTGWEAEARKAESQGLRVVTLRFGVVLEKNGGALPKLILPFKLFAGGWLGSGKQWFPWIHRDDVVGVIRYALTNTTLDGAVNVAAPQPVTMKEFSKVLGSVLHRPCWAPVPSLVLKIMLGELSEMLLGGQRIIPQKLLQTGYKFQFPSLNPALKDILKE